MGRHSRVSEATGLSRITIRAGLDKLHSAPDDEGDAGRIRRPGGGRKALTEQDPEVLDALEAHGRSGHARRPDVAPAMDLQERRQAGLGARGERASRQRATVSRLLHALGYSLQSNRKTIEGKGHPDRDPCCLTRKCYQETDAQTSTIWRRSASLGSVVVHPLEL